jgi:hypothetical protein
VELVEARDGTAVTKRCEVAPKARIVCGKNMKGKGVLRLFIRQVFLHKPSPQTV